jgi:hypothetical protein
VVPATLVAEVIRNNCGPIFTAHPGGKRTLDLISLRYWWPRIRQQVGEYVSKCDKCQRRKGAHQYQATLGEVPDPTEPFQVTSMDVIGPCNLTP